MARHRPWHQHRNQTQIITAAPSEIVHIWTRQPNTTESNRETGDEREP